jgi:hypothetical protein
MFEETLNPRPNVQVAPRQMSSCKRIKYGEGRGLTTDSGTLDKIKVSS